MKLDDQEAKAQPYLLRITSGKEGAEVEFEGTLMVQNQAQAYQTLRHHTPFEFRAKTSLLSGMFQVRSDTEAIQVELIGPLEGENKMLLKGNGQHVILYEAPLFGTSHRSITVF